METLETCDFSSRQTILRTGTNRLRPARINDSFTLLSFAATQSYGSADCSLASPAVVLIPPPGTGGCPRCKFELPGEGGLIKSRLSDFE
jgi:hypothetical protein